MSGYYHLPEENTSMIADVIRTTIWTKNLSSLQTQDLQTDLQHRIKHMKINGIIGLYITHLQGLPTLTRPPSPHIQLTWYSDDPLPDDEAANVVRVNAVHHRKDLCNLDSGASRIVFNHDSWLENTNSIPLTPTNTKIYGISGTVYVSNHNWQFTHLNMPRYDRQCFISRIAGKNK